MRAWVYVSTCFIIFFCNFSFLESKKLRFCTVDGRGGFKKAARYCPHLNNSTSKVECVLGIDRSDCLRKISKNQADFSVFTPEDLVTASNSDIELLVTNELRFTQDKFEYEVVAVVSNDAGIKSKYDLKDKLLCHPGYGYETDWTSILANYFEASVVPQTCNPFQSILENRISASSSFFKAACKAGPWVNDPKLDYELKRKYPNLCSLCGLPSKCSTQDKYWGRRGPLYCLTDGIGDVSWARLDDVRSHFGLSSNTSVTDKKDYSLLCPNGEIVPLNSTNLCIWVVKPWPVIGSKRAVAQDVQNIIKNLSHEDGELWKRSLLDLIETYHITVSTLNPIDSIENFLEQATGYLSANSFTGCHPPRTIKVCTTSNVENAKCAWIRESASVYGIEPDIDCIKAENTTHCMQAINDHVADVVMVEPDFVRTAIKDYKLTTLFYETVNEEDKYLTVPVVKSSSDFKKLEDLEGKKACFPIYDDIAWNSVIHLLQEKKLLRSCPYYKGVIDFFGESCIPNSNKSTSKNNVNKSCNEDKYKGEFGALDCLNDGVGQVAFVSKNSLDKYVKVRNDGKIKRSNFKVFCINELNNCALSWSPVGQGMIATIKSDLWRKEALDTFQQIDNLFGKNYKSVTRPITLFETFNGQSNILFHDVSVKLRSTPALKNNENTSGSYVNVINELKICTASSGSSRISSFNYLFIFTFILIF